METKEEVLERLTYRESMGSTDNNLDMQLASGVGEREQSAETEP